MEQQYEYAVASKERVGQEWIDDLFQVGDLETAEFWARRVRTDPTDRRRFRNVRIVRRAVGDWEDVPGEERD